MNETQQPAVAGPVEPSVRPLVERLREGTYYGQHALMNEAADEIETLRAAADAVLQVVKFYGGCYGCTPKDKAVIIALSRLLRLNAL